MLVDEVDTYAAVPEIVSEDIFAGWDEPEKTRTLVLDKEKITGIFESQV